MYGYGYRYNSGLVVSAGGGAPFANTSSLLFDGVDDYVSLGNITELNNASTFTYSGWYKQTFLDKENFMFASEVDINNYLAAYTWTDGRMYIANYVGGASYGFFDYSLFVTAGQWFHFAYVFNGSGVGNANRVKVYINGVLMNLSWAGTIPSTTATGTNISSIGKMNFYAQTWNGGIDECAFFPDAKTQSEITDIYNLGTPTDLSLLATPPTHWYRNGDNGAYKSPQWLIPSNENKDKVSNYSMDFDGTDQYLNIGAPSVLSNTSNFSISCWVKQTTSAINYRRVFGRLASASDMILLGTTTTTNNFIFYIENGGSYSFVESNVGIGFDVWKHVTLVFDGTLTGNQNRAKIYVDGVNVTATDSGTIPATTTADASDFYLGKVNGLGSFYYYGNMDEFAIFDYSLTPAEVLSISSEPTVLTSLSPTSWLKLGDNSTFAGGVWTVVDEVGTNDGSSVNMDIEDRIGEAPNSTNNALSSNMDFVDVVPDTP